MMSCATSQRHNPRSRTDMKIAKANATSGIFLIAWHKDFAGGEMDLGRPPPLIRNEILDMDTS